MAKKLRFIKVTFTIPAALIAPFVWLLLLYRRIRYGYPFRRIPLTRGKYAIVDPEDYWRLRRYKWQAVKSKRGRTFYASRGRRRDELQNTSALMHRQIINVPPNMHIDHINHNGLDNRKANIRPATRTQNARHARKPAAKTTSKYKGVSWHNQIRKWNARIMVNRSQISLGCFEDEIHAARAYDKAARKYHGQFAALNFESPRRRGPS